MITRWNVSESISREITFAENLWWDDGKELPGPVSSELSTLFPDSKEGDDLELEIDFNSQGYSDPGQLTGPYEDSYPPEGEDDRTVTSITVRSKTLSKDSIALLASFYEKEINEVIIDHDDSYDGDD